MDNQGNKGLEKIMWITEGKFEDLLNRVKRSLQCYRPI
jgi:hypothetical protein